MARLVQERARQRNLDALALRKALGAALEDVFHGKQCHDFVDAACDGLALHAVQFAEINQVLARGETVVQAELVGQKADAAPRGNRIDGRIEAVYADRAKVALQESDQQT